MMRHELKSAIKGQLLKEAGVIAEHSGLFGGTHTERVGRRVGFHGVEDVRLGDNGRVTGRSVMTRPIDMLGAIGSGASISASAINIASLLKGKPVKKSNEMIQMLGAGTLAASLVAGHFMDKKLGKREDMTDRLSRHRYSNFRNEDEQ